MHSHATPTQTYYIVHNIFDIPMSVDYTCTLLIVAENSAIPHTTWWLHHHQEPKPQVGNLLHLSSLNFTNVQIRFSF